MPPDDPFNLARFLEPQARDYEQALAEIARGQKVSHWMWYVLPQFRGLGASGLSQHYAITSLEEARAYLAHPVLGPRLTACARAALRVPNRSASEIFGVPDDMKLWSSATLFASVSPPDSVFHQLLGHFFNGVHDEKTRQLAGVVD